MNFRRQNNCVGQIAGVAEKFSRERQKTRRHQRLLRHFASRPCNVSGERAQFWRRAVDRREQRLAATRQLKGAGRPVNSENDRAAVLAALESVDGVCIFADTTATKFLAAAQPDIYVKGGDYTLETLNQDERRAVESAGGKIKIIPFVPGKSTTALLEKISRL